MYPIRDYLGGYYMSLIHWWPLNGHTKNYGTSGEQVTESNVTYTSGIVGQSMYKGKLNFTAEQWKNTIGNTISIAMWIYTREDGTYSAGTPFFGNGGMTKPNNRKFTMFHYPAKTTLHCSWQNDDLNSTDKPNTYFGVTYANFFEIGKWIHLCVVQDAATETVTIYKNGTQYSKTKVSGLATMNFKSAAEAPIRNNIDYQHTNDLRIYDHALSALEVKELSKGLVVHYSFNNLADEPTFNIIGDKTLSGHGSSWTKQTETFNGHTIYKNVVTKPNTGNNAGFTHSTFAYSQKQSEQPNIYLSFWKRLNVAYGKNLGGYIRVKYTDNAVSVLPWDYNKKNWSNDEASLGKWEYVTAKVSLAAGKEVKEVVNFYVYVDQATGGDCDYACIQIEPNDHPTPYYPGIRNFDYGDESGWGHDARQVNMGYTANTNNGINAAKFNGYSSHLEFDSFKSDMFTTPYTISFWVNPTDDGRAIYFGDYETTNTSKINFERAAGGGFRYFHNSNPNKYFNTDTAAPAGKWTMITVTYTPGLMTVYINGEPKDSLSHTATLTKKDNSVMRIGMDTRADTALYGLMSDFRFYVTCLSEEDVKILYESKGAIDNQNNLFANEIVEMNSTNLVGPNTWEQGGVTDANGTNSDGMQNRIRTKHIPVMGNTTYKYSAAPGINVRGVHYYDKDMNHIGYVGSGVRTTPENCAYVRWILQKSDSSASIPVADITSYKPQMILVDTNPHEQLMTTEERYVDFNNKYTLNTKDIIEGHDVGFFKDGTASGNQFNEI